MGQVMEEAVDGGSIGDLALVSDRLSGEWIKRTHPFLRHFKLGTDSGGQRPSTRALEALLGHGPDVAREMLERYANESDSPPDRLRDELAALLRVVRLAGSLNVISWGSALDTWMPGVADPSKARLTVMLDRDVDERTRLIAFGKRLTLSAFVEQVLREQVVQYERKHGALLPREPAARVGAEV